MRHALLAALTVAVGVAACAPSQHPAGPISTTQVSPVAACEQPIDRQDATYRNGELALGGEWLRPRGSANVPALILVHGSGASDRSNSWARQFAETLAGCGVAVLLTDKRGAGVSKGDWETAAMSDLVDDSLAGLAWIKAQPGIDHRNLGVLGLSQGGRLVAEVAQRDRDVDFAISVVGSARTLQEGLNYQLEAAYRAHGLSPEQAAELRALADASFVYARTGAGWDDYLRVRQRLAAGPLAPALEGWPSTPDAPYWTFWRKNADHDPRPAWRALARRSVRTLAVFGELDQNTDPGDAERLRSTGMTNVIIVPGAGHDVSGPDGRLSSHVIDAILRTARGR